MQDDTELDSEPRGMKVQDTEMFVESVVRKMDWSLEEQDVVMDIGCGQGNSCLKMFLTNFPRAKKVIGVDASEDMVEFAKENNAHEKIEYHVLDIEDRYTITRWSEEISKIISIYCFNYVEDQREAFQNIYDMLKPGGEAGLVFGLSTSLWDSYEIHYNNPKWSKYLEHTRSYLPESHLQKHGDAFYRSLLEDIGFNVKICEEEKRQYAFPTDEDCLASGYAKSALTNYIPDDLKPEFEEDLFEGFLEYNGRTTDGRPLVCYTILTLLIEKPKAE